MKTSFKKGQTPPICQTVFLKNLGVCRVKRRFQFVPFVLLADIPGIHVLADPNALDAHVSHHRRAVPTEFQLVIDFLPLVGTLNGRPALVNQIPPLRIARCFGKQPWIIARFRVEGTAKLGCRTATNGGTSPLATMQLPVCAVRLHFPSLRANRNALGGNVNVARRLALGVLFGTIDRLCIVSGIQKHFIYRAQGETLLEFDRAQDETDRVKP